MKLFQDSSTSQAPRKYGRLVPRHDARTLKLRMFMRDMAPPPVKVTWSTPVKDWLMLGNDAAGDCTIAAFAHAVMCWAANNGRVFLPTADQAIAEYSRLSGYDPAKPETDTGLVELDVLKEARTNGLFGRQIGAFAQVDFETNRLQEVKQAINLFGGVYVGAQIYASAEAEFNSGHPWETIFCHGAFKGSHAFTIVDYNDETQQAAVVTWGKLHLVSYAWLLKFLQEVWVLFSVDWLNETGVSPVGLDRDRLLTALAEITE